MMRWNVRAVLLGTGMGVLMMIVGAAVVAAGMVRGVLSLEAMSYWAAGLLVLGGAMGGLSALLGGGTAVDGGLTLAGMTVVLFALNAGLNGGQMEGIGYSVLALCGGGGAALLLKCRKGRGRRTRRRRKKS